MLLIHDMEQYTFKNGKSPENLVVQHFLPSIIVDPDQIYMGGGAYSQIPYLWFQVSADWICKDPCTSLPEDLLSPADVTHIHPLRGSE